MARGLTANEVFHKLSGVFFSTDGGTTGLVSALAAADQLDVVLTVGDVAAMSIVGGSVVLFGSHGSSAEVMVVNTVATETLTGRYNLLNAVASGSVATILSFVDLGATDENGASIETSQGETALPAGTQLNTYLFIPQQVEETLSFALRDFNPENIAQSVGILETGPRVTASPETVVRDPNSYSALPSKVWKLEGLLESGEAVTVLVWSGKVASANQTLQFAFGTATVIPFAIKMNNATAIIII